MIRSPFPIEQKAELLFKTNEEALRVKGVRFVTSSINSIKESRLLGTTDGSMIQQTFMRLGPNVTVTAVPADNSDFQTRAATLAPMGKGWEYIVSLQLSENVLRWAEEAVMKLSAPPVEAGVWDFVLHPSHLWLTIHESSGHPTELDRAMGYEANYAGTTFLAPPEKVLKKFKVGPEFMTIMGNRTEPGGCATCGWDDEGVAGAIMADYRQRNLRELPDDTGNGRLDFQYHEGSRKPRAARTDRTGRRSRSNECRT